MIKKAILALTMLLISSTALATSPTKPVETEQTTNIVVTSSIAYRYDVFKWSVPDNVFINKKQSELVWKNHIIQPGIKLEIEPQQNQFTVLGQVKYGYILKNQSKSWDYDWWRYNDPTGNMVSIERSKTKSVVRGNIFDLSGGVGYSVNLFKDNLLTFYVGYDYTDYRNKDYGAYQLAYKGETFPSNQLSSKYYFKTQSPWIGLSLNTPINDKFLIIPTIKLYSFKHIGKGYWVRRYDLKQDPSFKNTAKGTGLELDLDFLYKYSNNLDFKINLETKKFKMKKGQNRVFYNAADVGRERIFTQKVLDLSLMSSSISAGFNYKL